MQKNIFPIYKPKGPTSHDIVDKIRAITGIKKVGHAGTLDPQASGVLIIGITREGTKKLGEISKKEKEYLAVIKLGERSTTDDAEGEKTKVEVEEIPTRKRVEKVIEKFTGEIQQVPPKFSAVKVNGTPAYKLARQGKDFSLEPKEIEIKDIIILDYEYPVLEIQVTTGKGTYIRALARDIGEELRTGGFISELERVRVGDFKKEDALSISEFKNRWKRY